MDEIGVIHGRFQGLHLGHMEYLLAGKQRCKYLIIGIANPDKSLTAFSEENPHRSTELANPFTYYERFEMIRGAMQESGISLNEFSIVPFPINYPEYLFNYVPSKATYYITIYDAWGLKKKQVLEELGCKTEVMWRRTPEQKPISGTRIRTLIADNGEWKALVPPFVYNYITENGIDQRIRDIAKG